MLRAGTRAARPALAAALHEARRRVRSARKAGDPVRVQIDPLRRCCDLRGRPATADDRCGGERRFGQYELSNLPIRAARSVPGDHPADPPVRRPGPAHAGASRSTDFDQELRQLVADLTRR